MNTEKVLKNIPDVSTGNKSTVLYLLNFILACMEGVELNKISIIPWDTGMGKSSLICSFLREWKVAGFKPNSSILLAVATHDEIESLVNRSGLDTGDYSVFTGNDSLNRIGLGIDGLNNARVLFTRVRTH